MATYAGALLPAAEYRAASLVTLPSPQDARTGKRGADLAAGPETEVRPLTIRSLSLSGSRVASFVDDYYNRFHLLPALLNYGAVSGQATRTSILWNAWLTSRTITSINEFDAVGVELIGRPLPTTIRPLERASYSVVVTESGGAHFNGRFVIHADSGESMALRFVGDRARIWPYQPNWSAGVSITYAFKTDIITSRSGKEQRRALRNTPRKTYEYEIVGDADDLRGINRALSKWRSNTFVIGDPTRVIYLTDGLTRIDSAPDWLQPGRAIILMTPDGPLQRVVATVDPVALTLITETPGETYAANTEVRCAVDGSMLLDSPVTVTTPTNGALRMSFTLESTPGTELTVEREIGTDVHNGREVLIERPNWAADVSTDWTRPVDRVDFGRGRIETFRPVSFSTRAKRATFLDGSPALSDSIVSLFYRAKGQRGEFYAPTWQNDLPLAEDIQENSDTITVIGTELYDDYNDSSVYRSVMLRLVGGQRIYRKVLRMFVDGLNTGVQFDLPFFAGIRRSDIIEISWLLASRFASDELTIEWVTSQTVRTQFAIRSLEALNPEGGIQVYDGAAIWALEVWGVDGTFGLADPLDEVVNIRYGWGPMVLGPAPDQFNRVINIQYPGLV